MAKPLVDDELWESKALGRPPALTGILFVLKSGIPWEMLPKEMGCGWGMTCWRRLRDWQEAGVWQKLHELVLAQLKEGDEIDWSRALVDSASVRALGGGGKNRPQPHRPAQAGE
jgi:transposase